MKKLSVVAMLLIIASLILAACGGVAAPAEQPAAGDKVQIRWFVGLGTGTDPQQLPGQEKAVAEFNASQDRIELILEVVPYEAAKDTLATQIASGNGPDIIGPVGWSGSAAFYGQWLDLTPYIDESGFDLSVFDPALVEFYQTEEGQVGLPFLVFPAAIYYVPAMFDEAGLAYPPLKYGEKYELDGQMVDWNWETFTEVARRLTVDSNNVDATQEGFDKNAIVQVGFVFQWQTHVNHVGTYRAGAVNLVEGEAGNYSINYPESWKNALKWYYDGMYGEKPFMATGPLAGAAEFGAGNMFNSGKAAMAIVPIWYTCCLGDFTAAGLEFQAGALPVGDNGAPQSRVDADTFRIWKGTKNPKETFEVLSFLIGPRGTEILVVGADDVAAPYGGFPALSEYQSGYLNSLKERYPFTTDETWSVFQASLAYPDKPSAEQWQPNWNEAWARQQTFFDLLQNTTPEQLDFDAEWQKMIDDINAIYNK